MAAAMRTRLGGSPRGRGRPASKERTHEMIGWIPAGAGEPRRPETESSWTGVDPRRGGGDEERKDLRDDTAGGSPQGRGRPVSDDVVGASMGWIPAGAGKTSTPGLRTVGAWVDPRGGGGDNVGKSGLSGVTGGSPRGRGRLGRSGYRSAASGWIPAGAGETPNPSKYPFQTGVDPRGGGGDDLDWGNRSVVEGGSPRGRGRPDSRSIGCSRTGWIPAGAGKTACRRASASRGWVDPRGGGGDSIARVALSISMGGSPRGRGRLVQVRFGPREVGWIPAGAGETGCRRRAASRRWVDPRRGGGDFFHGHSPTPCSGGSPQGRGRHGGADGRMGPAGWIPAGAGETQCCSSGSGRARVDPRRGGGDISLTAS